MLLLTLSTTLLLTLLLLARVSIALKEEAPLPRKTKATVAKPEVEGVLGEVDPDNRSR